MAATAEKTDPKLWDRVKTKVTKGDKGGNPGQWSARKAQLAVGEYKKAGGGYAGKKSGDNHLSQWTREDWGTKSGEKSKDSGERYLPKKARNTLSDSEYRKTTAKKRADTKKGKQFSAQPDAIAHKTAAARHAGAASSGKGGPTLVELRARAAKAGIAGRSRMNKGELAKALKLKP